MSANRCRIVIALAVALPATGACSDPVFDPIPESDLYFSVFGILNASADTQWVRATPIRKSINTPDGIGDVVASLEHLRTHEGIVLRDSLLVFESFLGDGTKVVRENFWTAEPIEPGATYRLTVRRSDGVSSAATVPVAEAFEEVIVGILDNVPTRGYVRVEEAEHLAIVEVRHYLPPGCPDPGYLPVPQPVGEDGSKQVPVITGIDPRFLPCPVDPQRLINPEVFIVASGSEWPQGVEFATQALGILDLPSNVENGIGFLGGVFTKTIPWETCSFNRVTSTYCELTYNSRSARLEGVVHDAQCNRPLNRAVVELTEILSDPDEDPRVRTVSTKAGGRYRIGALDPGVRYVRRVSHPDRWPPPPDPPVVDVYVVQEDTIELASAEVMVDNVDLQRTLGPSGVPVGFGCGV